MQIHLNNRQLLSILLPFGIFGIFYIFKDDIYKNTDILFPKAKEYTNSSLLKKVDTYLTIEKELPSFEEILKKKAPRDASAARAVEDILYERTIEADKKEQAVSMITPIEKDRILNLEIIFLDKEAVVIDGVLLKKGDTFKEAEILDIKEEKVLIKDTKGKRWLYMFK